MVWVITAILLLVWVVGGLFLLYSGFREFHGFMTRMVSIAEKFYSLSEKY